MPTQPLTVELSSSMGELAPFRKYLTQWLSENGFNDEMAGELVLGVDEAITNICEHGYGHDQGSIQVVLEAFPDRVEVLLRDHAKAFDPTLVPPQKLPPERVGGVGIHFIRANTDRIEYTLGSDGANELRLVKMKAR